MAPKTLRIRTTVVWYVSCCFFLLSCGAKGHPLSNTLGDQLKAIFDFSPSDGSSRSDAQSASTAADYYFKKWNWKTSTSSTLDGWAGVMMVLGNESHGLPVSPNGRNPNQIQFCSCGIQGKNNEEDGSTTSTSFSFRLDLRILLRPPVSATIAEDHDGSLSSSSTFASPPPPPRDVFLNRLPPSWPLCELIGSDLPEVKISVNFRSVPWCLQWVDLHNIRQLVLPLPTYLGGDDNETEINRNLGSRNINTSSNSDTKPLDPTIATPTIPTTSSVTSQILDLRSLNTSRPMIYLDLSRTNMNATVAGFSSFTLLPYHFEDLGLGSSPPFYMTYNFSGSNLFGLLDLWGTNEVHTDMVVYDFQFNPQLVGAIDPAKYSSTESQLEYVTERPFKEFNGKKNVYIDQEAVLASSNPYNLNFGVPSRKQLQTLPTGYFCRGTTATGELTIIRMETITPTKEMTTQRFNFAGTGLDWVKMKMVTPQGTECSFVFNQQLVQTGDIGYLVESANMFALLQQCLPTTIDLSSRVAVSSSKSSLITADNNAAADGDGSSQSSNKSITFMDFKFCSLQQGNLPTLEFVVDLETIPPSSSSTLEEGEVGKQAGQQDDHHIMTQQSKKKIGFEYSACPVVTMYQQGQYYSFLVKASSSNLTHGDQQQQQQQLFFSQLFVGVDSITARTLIEDSSSSGGSGKGEGSFIIERISKWPVYFYDTSNSNYQDSLPTMYNYRSVIDTLRDALPQVNDEGTDRIPSSAWEYFFLTDLTTPFFDATGKVTVALNTTATFGPNRDERLTATFSAHTSKPGAPVTYAPVPPANYSTIDGFHITVFTVEANKATVSLFVPNEPTPTAVCHYNGLILFERPISGGLNNNHGGGSSLTPQSGNNRYYHSVYNSKEILRVLWNCGYPSSGTQQSPPESLQFVTYSIPDPTTASLDSIEGEFLVQARFQPSPPSSSSSPPTLSSRREIPETNSGISTSTNLNVNFQYARDRKYRALNPGNYCTTDGIRGNRFVQLHVDESATMSLNYYNYSGIQTFTAWQHCVQPSDYGPSSFTLWYEETSGNVTVFLRRSPLESVPLPQEQVAGGSILPMAEWLYPCFPQTTVLAAPVNTSFLVNATFKTIDLADKKVEHELTFTDVDGNEIRLNSENCNDPPPYTAFDSCDALSPKSSKLSFVSDLVNDDAEKGFRTVIWESGSSVQKFASAYTGYKIEDLPLGPDATGWSDSGFGPLGTCLSLSDTPHSLLPKSLTWINAYSGIEARNAVENLIGRDQICYPRQCYINAFDCNQLRALVQQALSCYIAYGIPPTNLTLPFSWWIWPALNASHETWIVRDDDFHYPRVEARVEIPGLNCSAQSSSNEKKISTTNDDADDEEIKDVEQSLIEMLELWQKLSTMAGNKTYVDPKLSDTELKVQLDVLQGDGDAVVVRACDFDSQSARYQPTPIILFATKSAAEKLGLNYQETHGLEIKASLCQPYTSPTSYPLPISFIVLGAVSGVFFVFLANLLDPCIRPINIWIRVAISGFALKMSDRHKALYRRYLHKKSRPAVLNLVALHQHIEAVVDLVETVYLQEKRNASNSNLASPTTPTTTKEPAEDSNNSISSSLGGGTTRSKSFPIVSPNISTGLTGATRRHRSEKGERDQKDDDSLEHLDSDLHSVLSSLKTFTKHRLGQGEHEDSGQHGLKRGGDGGRQQFMEPVDVGGRDRYRSSSDLPLINSPESQQQQHHNVDESISRLMERHIEATVEALFRNLVTTAVQTTERLIIEPENTARLSKEVFGRLLALRHQCQLAVEAAHEELGPLSPVPYFTPRPLPNEKKQASGSRKEGNSPLDPSSPTTAVPTLGRTSNRISLASANNTETDGTSSSLLPPPAMTKQSQKTVKKAGARFQKLVRKSVKTKFTDLRNAMTVTPLTFVMVEDWLITTFLVPRNWYLTLQVVLGLFYVSIFILETARTEHPKASRKGEILWAGLPHFWPSVQDFYFRIVNSPIPGSLLVNIWYRRFARFRRGKLVQRESNWKKGIKGIPTEPDISPEKLGMAEAKIKLPPLLLEVLLDPLAITVGLVLFPALATHSFPGMVIFFYISACVLTPTLLLLAFTLKVPFTMEGGVGGQYARREAWKLFSGEKQKESLPTEVSSTTDLLQTDGKLVGRGRSSERGVSSIAMETKSSQVLLSVVNGDDEDDDVDRESIRDETHPISSSRTLTTRASDQRAETVVSSSSVAGYGTTSFSSSVRDQALLAANVDGTHLAVSHRIENIIDSATGRGVENLTSDMNGRSSSGQRSSRSVKHQHKLRQFPFTWRNVSAVLVHLTAKALVFFTTVFLIQAGFNYAYLYLYAGLPDYVSSAFRVEHRIPPEQDLSWWQWTTLAANYDFNARSDWCSYTVLTHILPATVTS